MFDGDVGLYVGKGVACVGLYVVYVGDGVGLFVGDGVLISNSIVNELILYVSIAEVYEH